MGSSKQLSETVAKLYAAALNASLWREALIAVENYTGSTGAVLDLIPVGEGIHPRTLSGSFSPEDCADYALNFQSVCPRIAFAVGHPEIPTQFDRLILSESEMDRDPVYEWLGRHGLRYYIGGHGARTRLYQSFFSLQRSRRQGHVDKDDIDRFELIRPHLAQAILIADTLGTLAAHRSFSDAMLDALPQAVFGLGSDGVLLFTNRSGEKLLARRTCLDCKDGRLTVINVAQQGALDKLLAETSAAEPAGLGGTLLIRVPGGGQPYAARVSRITVNVDDPLMQATTLVVVNDPYEAATVDTQKLRALYQLTPGEARLAAALLNGHSLQSAGNVLGSSVETLRSHLKSVFRKVGVSRQQDLVRILAELEMSSVARAEPSRVSDSC